MVTRRGFTRVELMVVISAIGVLASILLPALARARESARRSSCAANLMNLGVALRLYADEHGGALPWSGGGGNADGLLALYTDYLGEEKAFICPSDANGGQGGGLRVRSAINDPYSVRVSYDYLGAYTPEPLRVPPPSRGIPRRAIVWDLLSGFVDDDPQVTQTVMADAAPNHVPAGGNILFLDGSVAFLHAEAWEGYNLPLAESGLDPNPTEHALGVVLGGEAPSPGGTAYNPRAGVGR